MGLLDFIFKRQFHVFHHTREHLEQNKIALQAFLETPSTNDVAKSEAFSISDPVKVYLADQQSEGRGRGENEWSNPDRGCAFMATFSFHLSSAPQAVTAPLVGLAVYNALFKQWPRSPLSLKAPNDLYMNGKKTGGLLVEAIQMGPQHRLLVGLGLNVFAMPTHLEQATYIAEHNRVSKDDWGSFLNALLVHLQWAAQGSTAPHLSESERHDLLGALNKNQNLKTKYKSVTPFGDLISEHETVSWRSL